MKKPNRLLLESSPYLQQHAYNPVDWHPWNSETLAKAKAEDKPILVSIGYSTCHWCHVMERESFEDEQIAAYMNAHFINIKVDREERPDIDAIYMEAVQLIQNGHGGWPLNCFLTPDGKPFFGGTYFPPRPAYQRASWIQVLQNLHTAFTERRADIEEQASKITHYIRESSKHFNNEIEIQKGAVLFDKKDLKSIFQKLQSGFDGINGGFGGAPKFPGTMALNFCFNYYLAEKNEEALSHVLFSLDKMALGGIYDHLRGGFARYTVDEAWLVPHFEKMLYDNALLVSLYSDVYKFSKSELYKECVMETLSWVEQEMLSSEGGFYSALDADSEGVEGKFYVWDKSEIESILNNEELHDIELFCNYYDITQHGNWEEKNILNAPMDIESFCASHHLKKTTAEVKNTLQNFKNQVLTARSQRIRPSLDDKILLDWNAMMITAYCKAYQALGIDSYKNTAIKALDFVLNKFKVSADGLHLYHSYKNNLAKHHAFLDDYALLIEALLEAHHITQNDYYKSLAKDYTDFVNNEFLDFKDHLYFFTSAKQQDILLHQKSLYDSATPSGNSTMIHNLQKLSVLLDENEYRILAQKVLSKIKDNIIRYPQSFGKWATALFLEVYPFNTISISSQNPAPIIQDLSKKTLFNTFIINAVTENSNQDSIAVCKDFTCHLPVSTVEEALKLL